MAQFTIKPMPDEALANIITVFEPEYVKQKATDTDYLFAACQLVANAQGMGSLKKPAHYQGQTLSQKLAEIANISQFRYRKVKLDHHWWQQDVGPLLAIQKSNNQPCVLLPKKESYELIVPEQNTSHLITAESAADLEETAYFFYQSFPDKCLQIKDLFSFAFKPLKKDILHTVSYQIAISSLGLFIPVITGVLFDQVIPTADMGLLTQIVAALIINALVITTFDFGQFIGLLRIKLKSNLAVQAAIWDRLLRLPMNFFSGFSSGDLAFRASSVDQIQQTLAGVTIQAIVNGLFSVISFLLMLYYASKLALWIFLMISGWVLINIFASLIQLAYQRQFYAYQGKLLGFLFQLLTNISKLRVANRETKIFALWSDLFSNRTSWFMKARLIIAKLAVFQNIFAVIATLLLFTLVIWQDQSLSFGSFIVFNAAFIQFFAAVSAMTQAFANTIQVIPLLARTKVILQTQPEKEAGKIILNQFNGKVQIQNVRFRYMKDNRLILDNISLQINPGNFIAIVGQSGAGKSTLLRLLLGFEHPESGAIFFDDVESKDLSFTALRQQFGVVLQNSNVMPASIFENITAGTTCTREEAWEVLHLTALADEVKAMPMQLDTVITEFGKTISVGQRQRLMLARALIRKPKILLLDEATSALDNASQQLIISCLSQLKITRIVITHRLHTIRDADCIYVLDHGEIVQSGTYQELMSQVGLFARLASQK